MNLVFLLTPSDNIVVDSIQLKHTIQVYVMLMITNLIKLRMGKLILNDVVWKICPEFHNEIQDNYFFKLTLVSFFLDCTRMRFLGILTLIVYWLSVYRQ